MQTSFTAKFSNDPQNLFIQSALHESRQKVSVPPQSRPDYSMTEVFVENFAKVQFINSLFFASSKFKRAPSSYLGRMATETLMMDENNKISGLIKTLADQTLSISTVN